MQQLLSRLTDDQVFSLCAAAIGGIIAIVASFLTVAGNLGIELFRQWRTRKREKRDAISGEVKALCNTLDEIVSYAHIQMLLTETVSGTADFVVALKRLNTLISRVEFDLPKRWADLLVTLNSDLSGILNDATEYAKDKNEKHRGDIRRALKEKVEPCHKKVRKKLHRFLRG